MYPVLPFGPFTIPTAPVIMLLAATIGLELAGRFGRRFGLAIDDIWNTGLIAILAGLIVARLWNVIQFWPVYLAEPLLILSIRPSGFVLVPGILAAIIGGYGYLLYRKLAPGGIAVSLFLGVISAGAMIQAGGLLTGELLGIESDVPWAVNYFGEYRHPVALYYGVSLAALVICLWPLAITSTPKRISLYFLVGIGVTYLLFGAFEANPLTIGDIKLKQFVGLLLALLATYALSQKKEQNLPQAKDLANITDKY